MTGTRRIALIGNVNNNNFALMRYFRDLGHDAHLLLWSNDGQGSMSHFKPEDDTWDIERWQPYIHQLSIANSYTAVVGAPKRLRFPPSAHKLRRQFSGYDAYVGSGIAPALMSKCGIRLDIFYPYSMGIEFVGRQPDKLLRTTGNPLRRGMFRVVRKRQVAGIRAARHRLNADMGLTRETFDELQIGFEPLAIPMVYNRERVTELAVPERLRELRNLIEGYEFKCFSHARHVWVAKREYSPDDWARHSKHNEFLIDGFAEFRKSNPGPNAVLILLEYGEDVEASKRRVQERGISDHVLWLPKMARKEILWLLQACDVGVGEFYLGGGEMWGGTGWEILASGLPLLQAFNFSDADFRNSFGYPPPPVLDVKNARDVTKHLRELFSDRQLMRRIGCDSKEWFDRYNGEQLASVWLERISVPHDGLCH